MKCLSPIAILFAATILFSCSSSEDSVITNEQSGDINASRAIAEDYIGTWVSDCLPRTESNTPGGRDSFIYDGTKAAFITELFADTTCGNLQSFVVRSGTITFGDSLVESTFGVTAHEFTFTSNDSVSEDFNDIIYTSRDETLFGDNNSRSTVNMVPDALNASRKFNLIGPADFSKLDDLSDLVLNESTNTAITLIIERIRGVAASNIELAINVDALFAEATINGFVVALSENETGEWVGQSDALPGSAIDIRVTWSENYNGALLILAQAGITIDVGTMALVVEFTESDYNYNFDNDLDGVSNFDERQQGTDPYDAGSN